MIAEFQGYLSDSSSYSDSSTVPKQQPGDEHRGQSI